MTLKKNFAVSVSLLMNDIQNFANLYRAFRDANPHYFDYEDSSSSGGKHSRDSDGEVYVPVVPALSDAFCSLQLIDTYRVKGGESTLREILQIQNPSAANTSAKSQKISKLQAENYSHSPSKKQK